MSDNDLVAAVASLQKANAWSDGEMARRLGISRAMWNLTRRGRRHPGTRVLMGIQRGFPDMHRAIALFLQRGVTRSTNAVLVGHGSTAHDDAAQRSA